MPLSNEKIAELQTIAKLTGKPMSAEGVQSIYDDYLLALNDPAAHEKKEQESAEALYSVFKGMNA